MSSDAVTVKKSEPPDLELPQHVDTDAVLLPVEVADDGKGLYPDSVLGLVKELRQAGITADYQHGSGNRSWRMVAFRSTPPMPQRRILTREAVPTYISDISNLRCAAIAAEPIGISREPKDSLAIGAKLRNVKRGRQLSPS